LTHSNSETEKELFLWGWGGVLGIAAEETSLTQCCQEGRENGTLYGKIVLHYYKAVKMAL
jgi:hypothetical protein